MRYEKEDLLNYSVSRLIDIIINLQEENSQVQILKKKLERIGTIANTTVPVNTEGSKRGRKPYTPEQRAAAYEEYKRLKREAYAATVATKKETV